MKKRILSVLCALAMVCTVLSGMVVVNAQTGLTPVVNSTADYDADTRTVTLHISYSGVPLMTAFQAEIACDTTVFNKGAKGNMTLKLNDASSSYTLKNVYKIAFAPADTDLWAADGEGDIADITFTLKDGVELPYTFAITNVKLNAMDIEADPIVSTAYTQADNQITVNNATATAPTPAVTKYTVTKGTGIKELSAVGEVDANTEVTVTANDPETGYELDKILVNNVAIDGNTFTVTEDATVTATFKKINYTVTGANGIGLDKATATYNEQVTITEIAIPVDKELVDITLNGVSKGKNFSTFFMPAENVTVAAVLQDKVVEPDPVVTFESDEVTANNAVGFWSKLAAFENAGEVKAAGFVFANVDEVEKPLETSQIKLADALGLGQTITYEFKNLTGYDKFGLKAKAYIVTDKGTFWSDVFGSLIDIVK